MDAIKFIVGIQQNNWNWDLETFKAKTGFEGQYAASKFLQFCDLATAMKSFDVETLLKLAEQE